MSETLSRLYDGCRSYRRFEQKEIPQDLLRELVDTARKRSCAVNAQKLRFVAVSTPEGTARIQPLLRWAARLPKEIGTPKEGEQPTAFIIVLGPEKPGMINGIDIGIALDTMAITAWEQGVGSCIINNVDRAELSKIIPVPDGMEIGQVLALGYPSHSSTVVSPDEEHGLSYYVDADRNYYVPKRPLEEVAVFL